MVRPDTRAAAGGGEGRSRGGSGAARRPFVCGLGKASAFPSPIARAAPQRPRGFGFLLPAGTAARERRRALPAESAGAELRPGPAGGGAAELWERGRAAHPPRAPRGAAGVGAGTGPGPRPRLCAGRVGRAEGDFLPCPLPPASLLPFLPLSLPSPSVTGVRSGGCLKLNVPFAAPAGVYDVSDKWSSARRLQVMRGKGQRWGGSWAGFPSAFLSDERSLVDVCSR